MQNFAKFQKFQLDHLVDFEKCCKTRIFLQKSVPIQPKTSDILPKFCQKLVTTLRVRRAARALGLDTAYPADLQMQSCAVKCARPKCAGVAGYAEDSYPCFCDGFLAEFDTPESGAVCGDLDLCENLCAETAGCFGFALEKGPAAGAGKNRCFLYPKDCTLSLADELFISDENYITYYKQEVGELVGDLINDFSYVYESTRIYLVHTSSYLYVWICKYI